MYKGGAALTTCTVSTHSFFDTETAALLVQTASRYKSNVTFHLDNKHANAKSIMGIISLGITEGTTLTVSVEGEDEPAALSAIKTFFCDTVIK
jgi:phosphotransferase system HPr (HPr) family protein